MQIVSLLSMVIINPLLGGKQCEVKDTLSTYPEISRQWGHQRIEELESCFKNRGNCFTNTE